MDGIGSNVPVRLLVPECLEDHSVDDGVVAPAQLHVLGADEGEQGGANRLVVATLGRAVEHLSSSEEVA